jgi:hypothetical protein
VDALRDDVRRGSASLDTYLRARRALAGAVERAGAAIQADPVD